MNKVQSDVIGIDVSGYDQSVEAFDAFIESLPKGVSPLSAMLDRLDSAASEQWGKFELAKPVTFLEIKRQASSGLPSGSLV